MDSPNETEFAEFAKRFVHLYWEEIANGSPEFADHEEPCEKTLEELLAEIEYQTSSEVSDSRSVPDLFTLRMADTSDDVWRFTFRKHLSRWVLNSAISGQIGNEDRVNLLDDVYSQWFQPFLDRIIRNALVTE